MNERLPAMASGSASAPTLVVLRAVDALKASGRDAEADALTEWVLDLKATAEQVATVHTRATGGGATHWSPVDRLLRMIEDARVAHPTTQGTPTLRGSRHQVNCAAR